MALAARQHDNTPTIDEQLTRDRNEVRTFATLLEEMKALNMPREKFDFWQINSELQEATKREYGQARERWNNDDDKSSGSRPDVQTGHSLGEPDFQEIAEDTPDRPRSTPAERVARMEGIIRESKGLEQFMALDEFDVLPRYHFLMNEFLVLMRDDVRQTESIIEAASPGSGGR